MLPTETREHERMTEGRKDKEGKKREKSWKKEKKKR